MIDFSSIIQFKAHISTILFDHNTQSNIAFDGNIELFMENLIKDSKNYIQPHYLCSLDNKKARCKKNAEVFTPSWMCNIQNNLIDNRWFGQNNVFNKELNKKWITNTQKIQFPNKKIWKEYVSLKRLEICCGEAPYLVSRYDSVTGEPISIPDRIGLLDRKLRIINENAHSKSEWEQFALIAYKSVYGYEKNGKNLLIARLNLFFTFIEYYIDHFDKKPTETLLSKISNIISWNLWQMDGLKKNEMPAIKLMDWDNNKTVLFDSLSL